MNQEEQLQTLAEEIQQECHRTVEAAQAQMGEKFRYQDATNVFIFRKLAELQLQIDTFGI